MERVRVTAGTNIYISAFEFRGRPAEFLTHAALGRIELAISDAIIDEITRTLPQKLEWPEQRIDDAKSIIEPFARRVEPISTITVVDSDPADNAVLECAEAAGSEYVVTGDRHLLRLKQYGGAKIVRVADFLRMLSP